VRVSLIEGLCLVAIGAAMVEIHDNHRFARAGNAPAAGLATAAKPAAVAAPKRLPDSEGATAPSDR
jgi:hypothetical protein